MQYVTASFNSLLFRIVDDSVRRLPAPLPRFWQR